MEQSKKIAQLNLRKKKRKSSASSKPVDVFQILRERIANQELLPGSKLKEADLAAEFGVSRARIREVFGGLEQRDLIERIPNRGAIVTRLGAKQVLELYDTREVLEGLAVRLATQNNPPEYWKDMVQLFGESTEKAIRNGDFEVYLHSLTTFREKVAEGCGNELLASLLDSLLERTAFLIHRLIVVPGRAEEGLKENRAVIEAMLQGNAERAELLKRENIQSARRCFQRYEKFVL